jgi:hypothetical protein
MSKEVNSNVCMVKHLPGVDECYIISYKPVGKVDARMVMWFPRSDTTDAKDRDGVEAIEAVKAYLEDQK